MEEWEWMDEGRNGRMKEWEMIGLERDVRWNNDEWRDME